MSRTYKTRPLEVRMLDKKDNAVGVQEVHNHKNGRECDLPPYDAKEIMNDTRKGIYNKCHYFFVYRGVTLCPCNICTGKEEHKAENRKSRHTSKIELHKSIIEHTYEEDSE